MMCPGLSFEKIIWFLCRDQTDCVWDRRGIKGTKEEAVSPGWVRESRGLDLSSIRFGGVGEHIGFLLSAWSLISHVNQWEKIQEEI